MSVCEGQVLGNFHKEIYIPPKECGQGYCIFIKKVVTEI